MRSLQAAQAAFGHGAGVCDRSATVAAQCL